MDCKTLGVWRIVPSHNSLLFKVYVKYLNSNVDIFINNVIKSAKMGAF